MTATITLRGPERYKLLLFVERERSGTDVTYDQAAELYSVKMFDGAYTITRNQVASALRDADDLRERWGNGARDGGERAARAVDEGAQEQTRDAGARGNGADAKRAAMREWLRTSWQPRRIHIATPTATRRVVGAGDFHGRPDAEVLKALVAAQADVYVLGGDLTDQALASTHPKTTRQDWREAAAEKKRDEDQEVRAFVELMLDETPGEVHWFLGNHDTRLLRQAYAVLPHHIARHYSDPLDLVFYDLGPRVKRVGFEVWHYFPNGQRIQTDHDNEFMHVFGDVMFSHLNFCQSQTEAGVSKLHRMFFTNWMHTLKLDHVRVLVHFHVHARTMLTRDGGHVVLVEPGMAGDVRVENYKHGYPAKWRPGVQGFVQFTQYREDERWRTDLGSVQLIAPRMARIEAERAGR